MASHQEPPFDAVLLLSFGGPEGPNDVLPFLENVTRGRAVPRERFDVVAAQYMLFGGVSPINAECRSLRHALETELAANGPRLPVYWGNRNWAPYLSDTVATMARDGVQRAVAVATSAYSSYSACRQYLEDIDRARSALGETAPRIEKIGPYWNHPGFVETMIENTSSAIRALPLQPANRSDFALVFTAHSLPLPMAQSCDYVAELTEASRLVAQAAAPQAPWDLVFQSRSGPPSRPWLEPDVRDHLRGLCGRGVQRVVVVPIGFVADHMEVVFDLDTDARQVAQALGMTMTRAACVGSAPRFVAGLRDLIAAHIEGRPTLRLGARAARTGPCPPGCCPPGSPPETAHLRR